MATNCFIVAALVLSIISWITGIIAIAVPEWYVVNRTGDKIRIGAFKVCSSGTGSDTCESISSAGFSFNGCDRSSDALTSRFGVVQGLGIVGIIVAVVATGMLIASGVRIYIARSTYLEARRREAMYNNNGNHPTAHHIEDESDDVLNSSESRAPLLEIIAFAAQLVSVGVFCAASFYFMQSVEKWLFCDQLACDYFSAALGIRECKNGLGWAFALALIAWIAGFLSCSALVLRWCLRDARQTPRQAYGGDASVQYRGDVAGTMGASQQQQQHYDKAGVGYSESHNNFYGQPAADGTQPRELDESAGMNNNQNNSRNIVPTSDAYYDNNNNQAPAAANYNGTASPFRTKKEGEPECELPEGNWEWDEASQLFWSEEQKYFFDHSSGHFYDPESGQWFNPTTNEWYSL